MMTFIKNVSLILIIMLTTFYFQSCKKEVSSLHIKEYPNVQSELWVYFQRFELAAAKRDIIINLAKSGISASIQPITNENTASMCSRDSNAPKTIIIGEEFWVRSNFLRKELAVFHELGHSYLNLEHREEINENGSCKSIMRSHLGDCVDIYNNDNRDAYQDELFY